MGKFFYNLTTLAGGTYQFSMFIIGFSMIILLIIYNIYLIKGRYSLNYESNLKMLGISIITIILIMLAIAIAITVKYKI